MDPKCLWPKLDDDSVACATIRMQRQKVTVYRGLQSILGDVEEDLTISRFDDTVEDDDEDEADVDVEGDDESSCDWTNVQRPRQKRERRPVNRKPMQDGAAIIQDITEEISSGIGEATLFSLDDSIDTGRREADSSDSSGGAGGVGGEDSSAPDDRGHDPSAWPYADRKSVGRERVCVPV